MKTLRITFPYMGNYVHAFRGLLEDLGYEVVMPVKPSKRTLDLGVKYAPEFSCLPYKIVLGTYLETLPKGVDRIVTSGGVGPCRAGLYASLHEKILKKMGYNVEFIVLEPPLVDLKGFYKTVQELNYKNYSLWYIYKAIKRNWRKIKALDTIEQKALFLRPRELTKGSVSAKYKEVLQYVINAFSEKEIAEAEQEALKQLDKIPVNLEKLVVKVGMVGEIYVLLEPSSNFEIEETIGHLGAEVKRSMFLTGWTRDNTLPGKSEELVSVKAAAQPYLPELIGGHGQDSIGNAILYIKQGFDGLIQLAPFTCIPEIVARTILTKISQEHNFPILTFFLDEQTGKAGMETRLEAFIDLLKRKKLQKLERAKGGNIDGALSWN
ncbi:CoA protein activase [Carboxydothermus islandicus]|uniref:CoA protein activase n=1 Tax=Carboxydothermus islandicus TaxID=661089 RepID=A0A1L8D403_9THEO|nr:acyl-CoA dehydratase activase-related protein [Carboxydothermus islandicus]GAV25889.1 CoA protein activase [Carboxydothermus islandicus]